MIPHGSQLVSLTKLNGVCLPAAFSILDDETKSGECVWIPANRPTQIWPDDDVKRKYSAQMKDTSTLHL